MIGFIWWASTTFLTLGFIEAVIKPIAKKWMQRRLLAAAPQVLKQLDQMLPSIVLSMNGASLDAYVRDLFQDATGEDWSQVDLEPFYALFDIRRAADNYQGD